MRVILYCEIQRCKTKSPPRKLNISISIEGSEHENNRVKLFLAKTLCSPSVYHLRFFPFLAGGVLIVGLSLAFGLPAILREVNNTVGLNSVSFFWRYDIHEGVS